ncbi:MAG: ParB N-terminal domain-containing protein [Bryobacteraceae bacterium]
MRKQAEPQAPPAPTGGAYERIELKDLLLDVRNPRLAELGITPSATQFDLVKALWEEMAVEEVAMSIAYSGYFDYEPLFVEPTSGGKYIVIEGNRRLAAVMLLVDVSLRQRVKATKLPPISKEDADALRKLPVIVTTRQESWRYLGFKHVNGPATWGSYAKAQYIAHVHNDYDIPLEEIAKLIGDYNSTVLRMYRGLMIVEQAEDAKVFKRADIAKNRFHFNYIYTGMDYPGIINFLGLRNKGSTDNRPVPSNKVRNLGDLMVWLYGRESSNTESLIRSQNPDLKTLDSVIQTEAGVKALRDGLPLSVAHDISQGDERIFRQALQQAKQALQKAHGTLTTGYASGEDDALKLAEDVDNLAHALVESMVAKRAKDRRDARKKG